MPPAETITITLPPDMLRSVHESVEAGEYASANAVLHDAMRLWQDRRAEDAARLDVIRARIRRSLDDPRPPLSLDEVKAHIKALHAATVEAHRNETS